MTIVLKICSRYSINLYFRMEFQINFLISCKNVSKVALQRLWQIILKNYQYLFSSIYLFEIDKVSEKKKK